MFSVLYKGYAIDYNGSATFNVYDNAGNAIESFIVYDIKDKGEAFQHILEWVDEYVTWV